MTFSEATQKSAMLELEAWRALASKDQERISRAKSAFIDFNPYIIGIKEQYNGQSPQ